MDHTFVTFLAYTFVSLCALAALNKSAYVALFRRVIVITWVVLALAYAVETFVFHISVSIW